MKKSKVKASAEDILAGIEASQNAAQAVTAPPASTTTPEEDAVVDARVDNEIKLEEKYGDQPLKAGALGAMRGGSLGISDQLLTAPMPFLDKPLATAEELREYKERNKAASFGGEAVGMIAPAVASGGTGVLARATTGLGFGAAATAKIAQLTERSLGKMLLATGDTKLAASVIQKAIPAAAGNALAGGIYEAGHLLSEDALGTREFNAENLLAAVGTGAVFGGLAGGAFGTAEALIPMVTDKMGDLVPNMLKTKLKSSLDPVDNSLELLGFSAKDASKIKANRPALANKLPQVLGEEIQMGRFTQDGTLKQGFENMLNDSKAKVNTVFNRLEELSTTNAAIMPMKSEVYGKVLSSINEFLAGKKSKIDLGKVMTLKKETEELLTKEGNLPFKPKELNAYRQEIDSKINYKVLESEQTEFNRAAKKVRGVLRSETDAIADRASTSQLAAADKTLLTDLKHNLDRESIALEILPKINKKIDKDKFLGFTDMVLGGAGIAAFGQVGGMVVAAKKFVQSDLVRRSIILNSIEKANNQVGGEITKSVSSFFSRVKTVTPPTSIGIMLNTPLCREGLSGKKPINKLEAMTNLENNINNIQNDPEYLADRLYKSTLRLNKHAPGTTELLQQRMQTAMRFLESKMPKDPRKQGMLDSLRRKWQPSSVELAKFERYIEAVESPMKVLKDIKSGSVSPEQVEALAIVYPDIHKRIQDEVMTQISTKPENMPYHKRLQLGLLLDMAADSSLTPEAIKHLQTNFIVEETKPEVNQAGMDKIKVNKNVATPIEKIQTRS